MVLGFNKELWTVKYWLHIGVIAIIFLGILQTWYSGEMLTVKNVLVSVPLIALGDVIAHNLLQLN